MDQRSWDGAEIFNFTKKLKNIFSVCDFVKKIDMIRVTDNEILPQSEF
jgi:hypothetical protein